VLPLSLLLLITTARVRAVLVPLRRLPAAVVPRSPPRLRTADAS
jgi:hypothetical protein